MIIPFADFYDRVKKHTNIRSQIDLAEALGIHRSAITQAKLRDAVPQKWILSLSRRYTLSPDWLEYGKGQARPAAKIKFSTHTQQPSTDTVLVPKVRAKVCAGGGSYSIDAIPVGEYPFPRQWLSRMGTPSAMIFMDVIGDSMEPEIMDGDMVLVDQSANNLSPHAVFAVGVEDAIYIKRIEKKNNAIILHSNNTHYSDIQLYGDELELFRIIGTVVWLCRDM